MKRKALLASVVLFSVVGATAAFTDAFRRIKETLTGYEEVPAVSTEASGLFSGRIDKEGTSLDWTLSYSDLEGAVQQAHIHFGKKGTNGGITVFLCTNLGNGPAGTQACPPAPATVTGTIRPADIIGPAGQGIAAQEFAELTAAIRAGVTYVNVHSSTYQGGEIRGQLGDRDHHH